MPLEHWKLHHLGAGQFALREASVETFGHLPMPEAPAAGLRLGLLLHVDTDRQSLLLQLSGVRDEHLSLRNPRDFAEVLRPRAVPHHQRPDANWSVAEILGHAYCRAEASVRAHSGLQVLIELVLRSLVLKVMSQPVKGDLRRARQIYRNFAERAIDSGLAPGLRMEASDWIGESSVEWACRAIATECGRSPSELVELFDMLAIRDAVRSLLARCEASMDGSAGASDTSIEQGDHQVRHLFWTLAACESWCREVLDRLVGIPIGPTLGGLLDESGSDSNKETAELVELPPQAHLAEFWECMRCLARLQLRLWQRRDTVESLAVEMDLACIVHPREACRRAVDLYCIEGVQGLNIDARRRMIRRLASYVPEQRLRWPFDDGKEWDDFERACARWFDRRAIDALERWQGDILRSVELSSPQPQHSTFTSRRRTSGSGSVSWLIRKAFTKYPVTVISSVVLVAFLVYTAIVGGFHAVQPSWSCTYLVIQFSCLLVWLFRQESRRFLPRSFFGTAFIWGLSIFPMVELLHKLNDIRAFDGGAPATVDSPELDVLFNANPYGLVAFTASGLLLCFGLILLQVRGRKVTRLDQLDRDSRYASNFKLSLCWLVSGWIPDLVRRIREDGAGLTGALKSLAVACFGSLWWGTVVFAAIAHFVFQGNSPADPVNSAYQVDWVIVPLSIWAVALAFIAQLMWQDQFLTEPMAHDA